MEEDDFSKLYLVSYLIAKSEDETIVGYSDLAARLIYLKNLIEGEDQLNRPYVNEIRDLVVVQEDDSLDWSGLRNLIERASSDDHGQMFLEERSKEMGPQKWAIQFTNEAPIEILETKLEEILGAEDRTRFLEKVDTAAMVDDEELLETVYPT